MLRAFPRRMRPRPLPLLLLLTGCGAANDAVLSGTLADDHGATQVWVVGGAGGAVRGDSFSVVLPDADTLDLRFADADGELARMVIHGARATGRLSLHDVWFEDGVAFPAAVAGVAERAVEINGLRLADAAALAGEIDTEGTLLAAAGEGDALLLRPTDASLPDLRVVITPGTLVRSPQGDPAPLDDLEFGDSLRLRGLAESGYVIATEIVVPRAAGRGKGRGRGRNRD